MTLPQTPSQPIASRVREVLLHGPPAHRTDMRSACVVLGVKERTLRRHLTAEGTSFAAIVSDTLLGLATRCLVDERRTIRDTATNLGFADTASFHRAFKRWTGMTPKAYRRLHAARPEATTSSDATLSLMDECLETSDTSMSLMAEASPA